MMVRMVTMHHGLLITVVLSLDVEATLWLSLMAVTMGMTQVLLPHQDTQGSVIMWFLNCVQPQPAYMYMLLIGTQQKTCVIWQKHLQYKAKVSWAVAHEYLLHVFMNPEGRRMLSLTPGYSWRQACRARLLIFFTAATITVMGTILMVGSRQDC